MPFQRFFFLSEFRDALKILTELDHLNIGCSSQKAQLISAARLSQLAQQGSMKMSGKHNHAICGKCEMRKREGNEAQTVQFSSQPIQVDCLSLIVFLPGGTNTENFDTIKLSHIIAAFSSFTKKYVLYYSGTQQQCYS